MSLRLLSLEQGSSAVETALILPLLLLILMGAVDFGRAYYVALEVQSSAQAGALYGIQSPLDSVGMAAAAKLEAPDVKKLQATATYGCECSDGSSSVPSCGTAPTCAYNVVNYVQVQTSVAYTPMLRYPGLPTALTLHGKARMRAAH